MLSDDHVLFDAPFRTARIGTMKVASTGHAKPLQFNEKYFKFTIKVNRAHEVETVKIKVPSEELTMIRTYFGRGCPMICFSTTPQYGRALRDMLSMKKGTVPTSYYDPESKVQAESRIVIVLDFDPIPYTVSFYFKKVLSKLCKVKKTEEDKIYSSLGHAEANSILVDVSGLCDKLEMLRNQEAPKPKSFGILQESASILGKIDRPSLDKHSLASSSHDTATKVQTASGTKPTSKSPPKIKNRARKTVPKSDKNINSIFTAKSKTKQDSNDKAASGSKSAASASMYNDLDPDFSRRKSSIITRPRVKSKRNKTQKEYRAANAASVPAVGDSLKTPFSTVSATTQPTKSHNSDSSQDGIVVHNVLVKCQCDEKHPEMVISGKEPVNCMGLDAVDSRLSRCIYSVKTTMMMRPSKLTPMHVLCDEHRERMLRHECCPACGMFCAGGTYLICVAVAECPHRFHEDCMLSMFKEKCCLHCLAPVSQIREVSVEPKKDIKLRSVLTKFDPNKTDKKKNRQKTARMGHKTEIIENITDGLVKTLGLYTVCTHKLPVGEGREDLEDALQTFFESTHEKLNKTISQIASQGDLLKLIQFIHESDKRELKSASRYPCVLFKPVICSNIPMVYLMILTFADVNVIDHKGKTALFYAEEHENVALIDFLIRSGANLKIKDSEGMMCIHQAAKNGRLVSCAALLRHDRDIVNMQDEGGWTPIVWATEHKHTTTAKYLEYFGADMMKMDKEGNTCLHWAALSGNIDLIITYLQKCGGIDIQNLLGDTALHIAARQDNVECVLCLINWGTDFKLRNQEGKTALQCAVPDSDSAALLNLKEKVMFQMVKSPCHETIEKRILSPDLSLGFENVPVPCVNSVDDVPDPADGPEGFHYVIANVLTSSDTIVKNTLKCKMQSCYCYTECTDGSCLCSIMGGKCWYNKTGELIDEFDFVEAPFIVECSETCWCPASCHNRVVQRGIKYTLQVHRTTSMGWSVRALETIPRGAFVCEYVGELISDAEADTREDDSYLFDLENSDGEIFCIDARFYGNVSRFINHLCDPNLMPIRVFIDHHDKRFPRLAYFSTKEIAAGEELGFDYGDRFWDIKSKSFTCGCGSPQCKYSAEAYRLKKEAEFKKSEEANAVSNSV